MQKLRNEKYSTNSIESNFFLSRVENIMSVLQSVSSVGCEQNHVIPTARAWYQFSTTLLITA